MFVALLLILVAAVLIATYSTHKSANVLQKQIISENEAIRIVSELPEVKNFVMETEKASKTVIRAVREIDGVNIVWNVGVHEVLELNQPTFNIYILDGKTGDVIYSTPQVFDEVGNFVCITDVDNRSCYGGN